VARDPSRLPPLDLVATFDVAARHLSFTLAASELFVTQSAVSRQVKALEDDLGVALFERRHRALALTSEGRLLHEASRDALDRLREVAARLRTPVNPGLLTVSTTPGFASLWLIPRLADFTRLQPKVSVRLDASYSYRDLVRDSIDVAIRYGRVGKTEGERLSGEEVMPVCSPALLNDRKRPLRTHADLANHVLLSLDNAPVGRSPLVDWDAWLEATNLGEIKGRTSLGFSDYDDVVQAALLGQGVALGRRPLIDHLLREGRLVAPFKGAMTSSRAYFVVVSRATRNPSGAEAFKAWLFDRMAAPT
jgi:DNA-binding transcriptional LysR family regulator